MKYEDKNESYYTNVRLDLLSLLPENYHGIKVLEIGAGSGSTLAYLKANKIATEVIGLDIPESKRNVNSDLVDKFIYGDIEKLNLEEYEDYFDCILLADVLEHLVDPDKVLKKAKRLLKEDGIILVSMPNIRHFKAFIKIFIKGNFSYEESGTFDYTHLRFFCKGDIQKLIYKGGFDIEKIVSSIKIYKGKSMSKLINKLTFGIFEEFFSVQYLLIARNIIETQNKN